MNAVQFGHWISGRRIQYGFRSQRALAERISGDPLLGKLGITEYFLARLEAGSFAYPFRGQVRTRVAALAWLLCSTPREVNAYYQAAGLTELDQHEAEQLRALHKYLTRQQAGQRVLPLPPRPQCLVGREPVIQEIIDRLLLMETGLYAITGLPGVGKSALASEVVHRLAALEWADKQVFADGIVAFTCTGRQGRSGLLSLLADVIAFFGPPTSSHQAGRSSHGRRVLTLEDTEDELASLLDRVRLVLADKHALIVLDDVEAHFPLQQAAAVLLAQDHQTLVQQKGNHTSPANRVILTTGCFIPAPSLVTQHLHLGPLSPEAACELLAALLKRPLSKEEVPAAHRVCASVGYLPLAIEVAATVVGVAGMPLPFLAAYMAEHPLDEVLDSGEVLRSRLARALNAFDAHARQRFALLSTLGTSTFSLECAAAVLSSERDGRGVGSSETSGSLPVEQISERVTSSHESEKNPGRDETNLSLENLADTMADLGQFVQHSLIELTPLEQSAPAREPESALADQRTCYHLHPLVYAHSLNMLKQSAQEKIQAAQRPIHLAKSRKSWHLSKRGVRLLQQVASERDKQR